LGGHYFAYHSYYQEVEQAKVAIGKKIVITKGDVYNALVCLCSQMCLRNVCFFLTVCRGVTSSNLEFWKLCKGGGEFSHFPSLWLIFPTESFDLLMRLSTLKEERNHILFNVISHS
jgi:hypothetical protein